MGRLQEVVIDCLDPARLATFWQHMLGGFQVMTDPEGNEFCLVAGNTPTTTPA